MPTQQLLGACIHPQNGILRKKTTIGPYTRKLYGYEYDEHAGKKEYTLLLVGASKCGKSTVINCIANFLLGIKSTNIRKKYNVIGTSKDKTKSSNTEVFTFFSFCTQNAVYNFIDSPSITNQLGFVDIERKQQFEEFFKQIGVENIKLNAVGLVIQNHFVRLPTAEENLMISVAGLLEENINNIIPFITYGDANTPPVLDALGKFQIDTQKHLTFNNVCFNPSTPEITEIEKICWRSAQENVQRGINIIMNLEEFSMPEEFPVAPRCMKSKKFGGSAPRIKGSTQSGVAAHSARSDNNETTNIISDASPETFDRNKPKYQSYAPSKKKEKKKNYAQMPDSTPNKKKNKKKKACVIS